jgi:hypothetical protein
MMRHRLLIALLFIGIFSALSLAQAPPVIYRVTVTHEKSLNGGVSTILSPSPFVNVSFSSTGPTQTGNPYSITSRGDLWGTELDYRAVLSAVGSFSGSSAYGAASLKLETFVRGAAGTPFALTDAGNLAGSSSATNALLNQLSYSIQNNTSPAQSDSGASFNLTPGVTVSTGTTSAVTMSVPGFATTTYTRANIRTYSLDGFQLLSGASNLNVNFSLIGKLKANIRSGVAPTASIDGPVVGGNRVDSFPNGSSVSLFSLSSDSDNAVPAQGIYATRWIITDPTSVVTTLDGTAAALVVNKPGTWTVRLRVTDDEGMTAETTKTFAVVQSQIGFSRTEIAYGTRPLDSASDQTFTISNNGTGPLIGSVGPASSSAYSVYSVGGTIGATALNLEPGASTDVVVRYRANRFEAENQTLAVSSNDPNYPARNLFLKGKATVRLGFFIRAFLPGTIDGVTRPAFSPFTGSVVPVTPANPTAFPLQYGLLTDNHEFTNDFNAAGIAKIWGSLDLTGTQATFLLKKARYGSVRLLDSRGFGIVDRTANGTWSLGNLSLAADTLSAPLTLNVPVLDAETALNFPGVQNVRFNGGTLSLNLASRQFGISFGFGGYGAVESYLTVNGGAYRPLFQVAPTSTIQTISGFRPVSGTISF